MMASESYAVDESMITPDVVRARILRLVRNILHLLASESDPTLALSGFAPFAQPGDDVTARFNGAKDLAALSCVLRTAYELSKKGKSITTRELYYMHAAFFRDQRAAVSAISRACTALRVRRHQINILAASRGWYAGLVSIARTHASAGAAAHAPVYDMYGGHGGLTALRPIPADAMSHPPTFMSHGARFILVVEKECIFRRLVEDCIWDNGLPCVVVTGCGMPDFATRAFVHALHRQLRVPVLGLSDWNPFGMAIMLCFRNGSRSKEDQGEFAVPLRWVGLRHDDLAEYALHDRDLQRMSGVDEGKARQLLNDAFVSSDDGEDWRKEVDMWLARREKMELEGLLRSSIDFISATYLPSKLAGCDWI